MRLAGAVAIVTGGGTGIGRATCLSLAEAGCKAVVVNYSRSRDEAEQTAADLARWPRYEDPRHVAGSRPSQVELTDRGLRITGGGWPGIVRPFDGEVGAPYLIRPTTTGTRDGDLLYLGTWREPQMQSLVGSSSSGLPAALIPQPWFPRERAFVFWARFVADTLGKHAVILAMIARLFWLKLVIMRDPAARTYMDIALTPVRGDEDMTLDLFTNTTGARAAVAHLKKVAGLTGTARVA